MRPERWLYLLALMMVTVLLAGCYNKPVKHLSADVALIQVGKTTEEDALVFLGQPDKVKDLPDGGVQWLYEDNRRSFFEKTPAVGKYIGSPTVQRVILTIKKGVVSDVSLLDSDKDDLDWSHSYSWQEKPE